MSRSEMMRRKRNSNAVDLIKLIKKIDCFETTLVCVFEGEDSKYYGSRIDAFFSEFNRKNLTCKGKRNVLGLRERIQGNVELSLAKILFFVDSDYDETETDFDLYSTPCYAIENLYAKESVFNKILIDELGLCSFKDEGLITELVKKYSHFEAHSDEALAELNAWLIARIKESETNLDIKLNLNNISIDKFLTIENFTPKKSYEISELDSIFSVNTPVSQDDLNSAIHIVNESDKVMFCRGKYRLEYFRMFLVEVFNESRNGVGIFTDRKIKPKLTLVKSNIISELSQYAETPSCLNVFLEEYKNRIAA
jgi:hypothetical protein